MPRVVANTTPLIAFAKVDQLDILRRLYGELLIPEAVLSEVKYEPARTRVREASWIRVLPIKGTAQRRMFSARLHITLRLAKTSGDREKMLGIKRGMLAHEHVYLTVDNGELEELV